MSDLTNNYISSRLDNQIDWYDEKSSTAKNKLFKVTFTSVICTCLIPVLAPFSDLLPLMIKIVISILSQIINICTWYINFKKLYYIRTKYRYICEILKTHKVLFEAKCSPYDDIPDISGKLFIKNCEIIMSQEHNEWSKIFKNLSKSNSQSIGS